MSSLLSSGLIFIVLLLICVYSVYYLRKRFGYWKALGVPSTSPKNYNIFGNMGPALLGFKNVAFVHHDIYKAFPGHKFVGMYEFFSPSLLIRDPELVGKILASDFACFSHRFAETPPITPLDFHLFMLNGEKWKRVRQKLASIFSESKLKAMFPIVDTCATNLESIIRENVQNGESFDAKEIAARFAIDVVGACMFGLDFNTLNEPNCEFRKIGKLMLAPNFKIPLLQLLRFFAPNLLGIFKISENPPQMLPFFEKLLNQNRAIRNEESVRRNDMMQMLLDLLEEDQIANVRVPKNIPFNEAVVLSNMFIMYAAGFETTSATISYCLLELALQPKIQQRLRDEVEVKTKLDGGNLTYENLKKMEFLEMVLHETLRKYSPAPFLNRICSENYSLPGTTAILPARSRLIIPVHAIHQDENFYPNPDTFDPERFTPENIRARPQYTYLPFGDGSRKCIAVRFDKMEIKLCLARLISKYNFVICAETVLPVRTEPRSFLKVPQGGIRLKAKELLRDAK